MCTLSNEELAEKIAAGETDLIVQLWQQVEKLITVIAKRYFYTSSINGTVRYEVDDLIQESYFSLLEAIKYYNADKKYSFITYLKTCLKTAFANVSEKRLPRQRNDGIKHADSIDVPLYEDSDESLADNIPSNENVEEAVLDEVYQNELHNALDKALETLTDEKANILREIYYNGKTIYELSALYNCSHQNIDGKKNDALSKLRFERKENGLEAFLSERTNYYVKVGVTQFKSTWISSTEKIVLARERLEEEYYIKKAKEEKRKTALCEKVGRQHQKKFLRNQKKVNLLLNKYKPEITKG